MLSNKVKTLVRKLCTRQYTIQSLTDTELHLALGQNAGNYQASESIVQLIARLTLSSNVFSVLRSS
jgi:hypothetical protein